MEPSDLKRLVSRYHNGKASRSERYVVERWLDSFHDNKPKSEHTDPRFLESFQQNILQLAYATNEAQRSRKYLQRYWAVAALLLCVISFSLIFYIRQPDTQQNQIAQKFSTDAKKMKRLILPDHTVVYLNTNSSLEIANDFGKMARQVSLKGEAYFEVARDTTSPFKVSAGELQIKVLGTSFNVNSQQSIHNISVAVNSGEVQVSDKKKILAVLHAAEGLAYNINGKEFQLMKVLPAAESAWWKGVNVLKNASYDMLKEVLYKCYDVTLESDDAALAKLTYTFTVRSTRTLEQTMDQLTAMLNKKYRKEGNRIIIY